MRFIRHTSLIAKTAASLFAAIALCKMAFAASATEPSSRARFAVKMRFCVLNLMILVFALGARTQAAAGII